MWGLAWLGSEACSFTPPTAWYSREKEGPPRICGQPATRGILGPHARIHRNSEHTQGEPPHHPHEVLRAALARCLHALFPPPRPLCARALAAATRAGRLCARSPLGAPECVHP